MWGLLLIFFNALVLCGLLYLFARDVADYDFHKVAIVAAVISLGVKVMQWTLAPYLEIWIALPMAAFIIYMLMKFCWVTFKQAVLILVLFTACHALVAMAIDGLTGNPSIL